MAEMTTQPAIEIRRTDDPKLTAALVKETIHSVYPRYYPQGAVRFFQDLHSEEQIRTVTDREKIYLITADGIPAGTGSIRKNEVCRLFILPAYQGKGYGSRLMDFLEGEVFKEYPVLHIDASFPAESMYLKRGYQIASYEKIETENGDFLCYHTMEKKRPDYIGGAK